MQLKSGTFCDWLFPLGGHFTGGYLCTFPWFQPWKNLEPEIMKSASEDIRAGQPPHLSDGDVEELSEIHCDAPGLIDNALCNPNPEHSQKRGRV